VRLGFYDLYLGRPTERIYEDAARKIYRAKRDRRKKYYDRRRERRQEKDELLERELQERKRSEDDADQQTIGGPMANIRGVRWPWSHRDEGSVSSDVSRSLDLENGTQRSTNGKHDYN
jgi:hypothetical protein